MWNRIIVILYLLAFALFAGNTGKISGVVTDKNTGEPLAGVNVVVKGKPLGAATDQNGFYYILQIPPGVYTLEFSYIGYRTVNVTNVKVHVDLTTHISVKMEPVVLNESKPITVVAERPIIQKDITSTKETTTRGELEKLPGMEKALDMFRTQGGVFYNQQPQAIQLASGVRLQVRDESLKDIHIRGGRGGEVLYMIDGVPVTHPLYGGRSVIDLNVEDVQEVEMLTGGFNAEYGQAQSGVINITTRSGSNHFEGGIEYKNDYITWLGPSYQTDYTTFYLGGPEFLSHYLLPKLGIKLPGNMTFFFSANTNLTNTEYNNHRHRKMRELLGIRYRERQDNTGNLNLKIDWRISPMLRIATSFHGSWKRWSRFDWLWKYYPDHTVGYGRDNQDFTFRFNHTLSKSTFYDLSFGYLGVKYRASLNGTMPHEFWKFYKDSTDTEGFSYDQWLKMYPDSTPYKIRSTIKPPTIDELTGFFNSDGYECLWRNDNTKTFTFRGSITSQVHSDHLIKSGFEVQYNDLRYVDIEDGGYVLSNYGKWRFHQSQSPFPKPPGVDPEFGQNRWVFHAFPLIGGAYIQDKFEHESLIINAGVRVDWFMPGESVFKEDYKRQWQAATGLNPNWKRFRYKISPRFGISFPISTRTVLFFSYGHFNQLPELQFFYRDPYSGGFTGNPHLGYEQTVLYEFGFTHQIFRDMAIDIKSYTKDISQQVGTTALKAALGVPVSLYDNKGYARARGLEFRFEKRYSHYFSSNLTYTVQWATGYSSSAFDDYKRSLTDFPNPIRERRLAWDVRHQIIFEGMVAVQKKRPKLLGWRVPGDWTLTVLSNFASGYPYTPGTTDLVEMQTKENTKTGPPISTTDMKFQKYFYLTSKIKLTFMLDVFNIFDQKNVQIGYGFNPWTGKPYRYGDVIDDQNKFYTWYDMYRLMDPRQFSTGRYAKFGIKIDW